MEAHITEAERLELDALIDGLRAFFDRLSARDVHCGMHVVAWADQAETIACCVAAHGCMPHTAEYVAQHLAARPLGGTAVMLTHLRQALDPTWPSVVSTTQN